jgi:ribosome-associated protein
LSAFDLSTFENTDKPEKTEKAIRLEQFLKWVGATSTGGQAKLLIQAGEVTVNGEVETRRKRQLAKGDRVALMGEVFEVAIDRS